MKINLPVNGRILSIGMLLSLLWPTAVMAQKPQILRVEAHAADPFGVAKVTFRMGQSGKMIQNTGAVRITERDGRLFYPASSESLMTTLFDRPAVGGVQSVWFLFRGTDPLNLTLQGATPVEFTGEMSAYRPALARILFNNWWRQFNAQTRRHIEASDYPPLVESYLTAMLERRLNLIPPATEEARRSRKSELQKTFSRLFDVESLRAETIRSMLIEPADFELANLEVPAPPVWQQPPVAQPGDDVKIEPIVRFVPEECYYLRFGSWDNQLWMRRLMDEYSGDLTRMITLRGHQVAGTTKMLEQLVLESNQMEDWFGGNLIADVAAIGTDMYMGDGSSNAILMLAKNKSLESRMRGKREKYAKDNANEGVTLTKLEIAGHPVTLLSTEDNRIRSFFAVKDLCYITSSSATIVRRFLEAADGQRSLQNHDEFRLAREVLPIDRDDTVFIYLSRPFFQNLLSPRYQVELARRHQALANLQLYRLAQWAAANEGFDNTDIAGMITEGFLPDNFNRLPDGSAMNRVEDQWHDTLRGRRGYFKPIADMSIDAITATEAAWLSKRIEFYERQLKEVDPILIGLKRFEVSEDVERIVIDGRLAPFGKDKYGWIGRVLGPPLEQEVDMGPDALISLQASIAPNMLAKSGQAHQIFASVQGDVPPKMDSKATNLFQIMKLLKTTPGYVGAWPNAGYLDLLPALGAQPDAEGFTYSRILSLWRMQQEEFSLVAFDRQRLQNARQHLNMVPAERPAQIRLRAGDISSSNLRDWANVHFFNRSWETSIANVQLLNTVIQQFNLPTDMALTKVQELLGINLVCPLNGEYELVALDESRAEWYSSRWPSFDDPQMPDDYLAPPMEWFRGLSLDVYQRDAQFVVHGYIDIARDPQLMGSGAGGILGNLPSINMFKGFSKVDDEDGNSKKRKRKGRSDRK